MPKLEVSNVKKDDKKPEFAAKNKSDIGKELKKINKEIAPMMKATNDPIATK